MAKTHIMRWAPQDYRTCRVRARSAATRDPMLRLVYLEALSALYESGGTLPADPTVLADELLLPSKEIARCLPVLDEIARTGSGRGGLLVEDGHISNGRVTIDLKGQQEFIEQQAEYGRKGARAKRKAASRQPKGTSAQPLPLPLPLPVNNLVEFYNHVTNRKLSPDSHAKFITPRLNEGATVQTLKLAIIGACLQPFHLGQNERRKEYLDPETILRPGRFDGHAELARQATFRIQGAEDVWQFWMGHLKLSRPDVMRHFFDARDSVLREEGAAPLGAYGDGRPAEEWIENA